jgi:hypothetical protein
MGAVAAPNTPAEFAAWMAREAQVFRELIDRTGITAG